MRIERAVLDDAQDILSLQKLAYQSEAEIYHDHTLPPLTQTLEEIQKDFETQLFLKAVEEGQTIGSVRTYTPIFLEKYPSGPKNRRKECVDV